MGEVTVDPRSEDFFRAVVEERKRSQREGLEERAKGLKVLANATSYGIYAQMTRHELGGGRREELEVFSDPDEPWSWRTSVPEDPGDFCFPALAASITGGARLMLGLLERLVTDRDGTYAFCDTDSMAVVASKRGGPVGDGAIKLVVVGRGRGDPAAVRVAEALFRCKRCRASCSSWRKRTSTTEESVSSSGATRSARSGMCSSTVAEVEPLSGRTRSPTSTGCRRRRCRGVIQPQVIPARARAPDESDRPRE